MKNKFIYIAIIILLLAIIAAGACYFYFYPDRCEPAAEQQKTETISLYYYIPANDKDETGNIMCSSQGLFPIKREINADSNIIENTIKLLIRGQLTEQERSYGITTEYPLPGFELIKSELDSDGLLTLTFNDPQNLTGGGSCRVGILWFQIGATAKQFPEVKQVRFLPEELFQP